MQKTLYAHQINYQILTRSSTLPPSVTPDLIRGPERPFV